jgi:hypothetical protein
VVSYLFNWDFFSFALSSLRTQFIVVFIIRLGIGRSTWPCIWRCW